MAEYELSAREINSLYRIIGQAPGQAPTVADGAQREWLFRHFDFTDEEKGLIEYWERPATDGNWQFGYQGRAVLTRTLSPRQIAKLQQVFDSVRPQLRLDICAEIDGLATRLGWWAAPEADWGEEG